MFEERLIVVSEMCVTVCDSALVDQAFENAKSSKDRLRPRNAGPMTNLKEVQLSNMSRKEKEAWMFEARLEAIIGSCRLSLPSVRSGIKCYLAFVFAIEPSATRFFPPSIDRLLHWSRLFRCAETFGNYLSYLRTACYIVNAETRVFECPELQRAKASIRKAGVFSQRPKLWIQRDMVEKLMLCVEQDSKWLRVAYLFLITYVFLGRLPSETLPVVVVKDEQLGCRAPCQILAKDDQLILRLKRRKNKPRGSVLIRRCWCQQSRRTCPVHVVGKLVNSCEHGVKLFDGITPAFALGALRDMLSLLQVPQADMYRTHDLRRGHALDLQLSGAPLWEILAAGEWRSPAFLKYLDQHRLEIDLVVQAHCDESDGDF